MKESRRNKSPSVLSVVGEEDVNTVADSKKQLESSWRDLQKK